jgi:hypothetical protein
MATDLSVRLNDLGVRFKEASEAVRGRHEKPTKVLSKFEMAFVELDDARICHDSDMRALALAKDTLLLAEQRAAASATRLEAAEDGMAAEVAESRAGRMGEVVPILSIPNARRGG